MKITNRVLFPLLITLFCSGCASYTDLPPGSIRKIESPVVEQQSVVIPPPAAEKDAVPSGEYALGAGDILSINVGGRPELSSTGTVGGKTGACRIDGAGRVYLPHVGSIAVAGLTVPQAQQKIAGEFARFLKDPWVVVEVAEYRSKPLYLLGQFRQSGVVYMDRPLTLLQGIGLGNGFESGSANIRAARLMRDNRIIPVDLYDLLTNGDQTQNVWLKPGDTIFIPDNRNQQVFVFGAVKKPGPIALPAAGLSLTEAIANAELRETGYDFRHVRIIRSYSPTKGELLVVDFDRILRGEALPVRLKEGDIVYVPKNGIASWNDAIGDMLPSLHAVGAILQPFVSIKYLSQ